MARGRRGKRRTSARGHRSNRRGEQRRGIPIAVSLAAVPVGLALAGGLLSTGVGEDLNPFRNTADSAQAPGEIGDAVTGASPAPEASEGDDFFALSSTAPDQAPTPSGDSEPQSAGATASSVPEDADDEGTEHGGSGGSGSNGQSGNGGGDEGRGDSSGPSTAGSAVTDQVVTLVNNERANAGCGPLRTDSRLASAAQDHSEDMSRRNYMSHHSPEGEGPGERAHRHGYNAWGAENVAKGQSSPQQVMDAWMNSTGHRENILNCGLVAIGVGESGNAWTQLFGWE